MATSGNDDLKKALETMQSTISVLSGLIQSSAVPSDAPQSSVTEKVASPHEANGSNKRRLPESDDESEPDESGAEDRDQRNDTEESEAESTSFKRRRVDDSPDEDDEPCTSSGPSVRSAYVIPRIPRHDSSDESDNDGNYGYEDTPMPAGDDQSILEVISSNSVPDKPTLAGLPDFAIQRWDITRKSFLKKHDDVFKALILPEKQEEKFAIPPINPSIIDIMGYERKMNEERLKSWERILMMVSKGLLSLFGVTGEKAAACKKSIKKNQAPRIDDRFIKVDSMFMANLLDSMIKLIGDAIKRIEYRRTVNAIGTFPPETRPSTAECLEARTCKSLLGKRAQKLVKAEKERRGKLREQKAKSHAGKRYGQNNGQNWRGQRQNDQYGGRGKYSKFHRGRGQKYKFGRGGRFGSDEKEKH